MLSEGGTRERKAHTRRTVANPGATRTARNSGNSCAIILRIGKCLHSGRFAINVSIFLICGPLKFGSSSISIDVPNRYFEMMSACMHITTLTPFARICWVF